MEKQRSTPILFLAFLSALLVLGWVISGLFNHSPLPQSTPPPIKAHTNITLTGQIACLPKRTTGPQTLECAIGLRNDDGQYYVLKDLFNQDPDYSLSQTDTQVKVTGTLTHEKMVGPDGNPYDIGGVITIRSIQKLKWLKVQSLMPTWPVPAPSLSILHPNTPIPPH